MTYLWLKAGHIIFMVFWMAGLFILPRQMLYLHPYAADAPETAVWKDRIGKLRHIILTPSLIVVWVLGFALAGTIGAFSQGWVHAKLLLVLLLKPSFRLEGAIGCVVTVVASAFGGFTQGAAGVSGPLFSTLIMSFRLKREAYVFYNGLVFGLFNVFQIGAMIWFDMFTRQRIMEGFLALIPLFIFQYLGMRTMGAISTKAFNAVIIMVIVAMEIKLVWGGLGG